ncbi:hypothetical protein AgCh_006477 [Apium graveolens]
MYENEGDSATVVLKIDTINVQSRRFLSRESSVGQSSRIYHRSAEGVPFNWETQPGTPKNPRREEVIPPPTPPPGSQSFFPPIKHCADHLSKEDSYHSIHKLWFWRKHLKKQQTHKDFFGIRWRAGQVLSSNLKSKTSDGRFDRFADFGGGFSGWVDDSSTSESKSSSSSNGSMHQSKDDREHNSDDHGVHKPFGCSPWNMNGIMVRVVKRN